MLVSKKSAIIAACILLASCGKEKLNIEGQRLSILEERGVVAPDYSKGDINIVLPTPVQNKNWSQEGGNSKHQSGHLASADSLEKYWNKSFGKGNSKRDFLIATPVIAEKTVFTIDANAVVSAFSQENGDKKWQRKLKPQIRSDKEIAIKGAGLAYDKGSIYAVTGFSGVFAINAEDGKVNWSYFAKTPIRIAPTVGGGKVFIQTIDNTLIALNGKTGAEIWRYVAPSEDTTMVGGAASAYSAELDLLIAGFNNGELQAFKASTGSPLWSDFLVSSRRNNSLADINSIHANPVIVDNIVYAIGNNNVLVAIDVVSGQRSWEREIGSNNQPWIAGKYMFLLTKNAELLALDTQSGKIVWKTPISAGETVSEKVGVTYAGPVLVNNRLLVSTSNGYIFYVSPYTGEIMGFVETGEGSGLSPVVANGQVIITTNDADIIAYQ